MYEVADFARGEGQRAQELLNHKIKHLRFTFDKSAGERSHDVLTQLLADPEGMGPKLRRAAAKLSVDVQTDDDLTSLQAAVPILSNRETPPTASGIEQ